MAIERFKQQPLNYGRVSNEVADAQASISNALFSFGNRALGMAADEIKKDRLDEAQRKGKELGVDLAESTLGREIDQNEGTREVDIPEGGGDVARAFRSALYNSYRNELALDARDVLSRFERDYARDPEGFSAALEEYRAGLLEGTPEEFRVEIDQYIRDQGGASAVRIADQRHALDLGIAAANQAQLVDELEREALNLIASGDEQKAAESLLELQGNLVQGVEDGLFDPKMVQQRAQEIKIKAISERQFREFDLTLKTGDYIAASKKIAEIEEKDIPQVSPEQKRALVSRMETQFRSQMATENAIQSRLDKQKDEMYEANATALIVQGLNGGNVDREAVNLLSSRKLDIKSFNLIKNTIDNAKQSSGNDMGLARLRADIIDGEISTTEQLFDRASNYGLSGKQLNTALGYLDSSEGSGGLNKVPGYKRGNEILKKVLLGSELSFGNQDAVEYAESAVIYDERVKNGEDPINVAKELTRHKRYGFGLGQRFSTEEQVKEEKQRLVTELQAGKRSEETTRAKIIELDDILGQIKQKQELEAIEDE